MIELYTSPGSPCAQKVQITLAEKNLDWVPHLVNLQEKENLKPEYLRINPNGVVPSLLHDGQIFIESSVIDEYLDETFTDPPLKPERASDRARMRVWTKWVDEKLHPALGNIAWPVVMRPRLLEMPPEKARAMIEQVPDSNRRARQLRMFELGLDAPEARDGVEMFSKTLDRMESALEGSPWVVGDRFSLADVSLVPYLNSLDILGWLGRLDGVARCLSWLERVRERPSFEKAVRATLPDETRERIANGGEAAWEKVQPLWAKVHAPS